MQEEISSGVRKGEPLQGVRTSDKQRLSQASGNSELPPPVDVTVRPPSYVTVPSPVSGAGGYKYRPSQPRRHFFWDHHPVSISLSLSLQQQHQHPQLRPKSPPLSSFEREAIRNRGCPWSRRLALHLQSSDWYWVWHTFHRMGDRKRKVVRCLEF